MTLVGTISIPMIVQLGRGFDDALLNSTVVYAETQAAGTLLNTITKYLVQRPRPYTHSTHKRDPNVAKYIESQGDDAYLSFYSGHSSAAFSAAISGSYLFGSTSTDTGARKVMWGVEMALAGATANLRVRAGKHYYSDVITGALVGSGLGIGIPLLHGGDYRPSGAEIGIGLGGLAVGIVGTQLLPFGCGDVAVPVVASTVILPSVSPNGAGVQFAGTW